MFSCAASGSAQICEILLRSKQVRRYNVTSLSSKEKRNIASPFKMTSKCE